MRSRLRPLRAATAPGVVAALLAMAVVAPVSTPPAAAAGAKINGSGSTYVALAMQQWVADAQTSGLSVNYLPTGSPQGLQYFAASQADFAGTEAEYSALGSGPPDRGFQYVPDVAGAVAVMYNATDKAGKKVDYLHLSRSTVARIFMGDISRWSDPAISTDNKGLELPDEPINVVYRAGQSGTTALFYDFVATVEPDLFRRWAAQHQLPTSVRIITLPPDFAPKAQGLNGSDQIAQHVASPAGRWSIAYDEFGYAKTYKAEAAWIQNQAGEWVLPFAQNISAALESARLRDDLSQELSGVYNSPDPVAYPISAYSYLVTQCAVSGDRPTCKGTYTNTGVTETLAKWMRYIACEGQVSMSRIGYSPLPPNLSQELVNSIGRLQGSAPEVLNADNCANPRFRGGLGEGATSPVDPQAGVTSLGNGAGGGGGSGGGDGTGSGGAQNGSAGGSTDTGTGVGADAAALVGSTDAGDAPAVGGGSGKWRKAAPVAYARPIGASSTIRPLVLLVALLCIPPLVAVLRRIR